MNWWIYLIQGKLDFLKISTINKLHRKKQLGNFMGKKKKSNPICNLFLEEGDSTYLMHASQLKYTFSHDGNKHPNLHLYLAVLIPIDWGYSQVTQASMTSAHEAEVTFYMVI